MKHKHYLLQLILLVLFTPLAQLRAQLPIPICTVTNAGYVLADTSSPYLTLNQCKDFLNDFIPKPTDRILTVKVNFVNINKDDGTGKWDHNSAAHCQAALDITNDYYSQVDTPVHPRSPAAQLIRDTRIRFVMGTYTSLNSTAAYESFHDVTPGFPFADCDAITVIYARTYLANSGQGAHTYGFLPAKYIFFPGTDDTTGTDPHPTPDDYLMSPALPHELAHALGLNHVFDLYLSHAKSPFADTSCCKFLIADDVEHIGQTQGSVWGHCPHPHQDNSYGFSNNIVSDNFWCRRYISPKQIALMHYNLRYGMKDVLTAQAYTAALTVDHQFDHTVSGGTENWSTDRYMKGDVIISPGAKLVVGCNLAMAKNARILVKPGAQLLVLGRITNISGELWSGVQVGGADTLDQSFGNNGFANHQGVMRVSGYLSSLSNAENAIKNYLTDTLGNIIWGSSGGIVLADNVRFINNNRDVEFLPFHAGQSVSSFYRCDFKKTGPVNTFSSTGTPLNCVSLWDIQGVKFRGCKFSYGAGTYYNDHGSGIESYDAAYSVDTLPQGQCTFSGWKYGAISTGANPLRVPAINNSSFYDNTQSGAYFQNITALGFNNNYLRQPAVFPAEGLYLQSCNLYNVTNNTFLETTGQPKSSVGVRIYNSATGSHQVYRNNFNNLYMGISALGNNASSNRAIGLKMNCNDFSAVSNKYDVTMLFPTAGGTAPTVKKAQGGSYPYLTSFDPVRNIYGANVNCSGCEEQWYIDGNSSARIDHPSNTQAVTQPTPQPGRSDTAVYVIYTPITLNYSAHCTPGQLNSGNSGTAAAASAPARLDNINSYLATLIHNNTDDVYHFEIESALSTKLNLFLTDSLVQDQDSVIALLEGNTGRIVNADILTVYAYMNKGDLVTAQSKINALGEDRGAWKALLTKLIVYQKSPQSLYNMSNDDVLFWEGHTTDESKDGYAAAQSVLKMFNRHKYEDPRPEPSAGELSGRAAQQADETKEKPLVPLLLQQAQLSVFPNPANDLLFVKYTTEENKTLQLQMVDALGRIVYTGSIKPSETLSIPLSGLTNGVYQLNAYYQKSSVFRTKVICIK